MATLRMQDKPTREGLCKGCNAAVLWATTANGKPMILDRWEPSLPDGDGLVTVDSSSVHWATCPERQQFVRGK